MAFSFVYRCCQVTWRCDKVVMGIVKGFCFLSLKQPKGGICTGTGLQVHTRIECTQEYKMMVLQGSGRFSKYNPSRKD